MDQPTQKGVSAGPQAIHHELRTAENSAAYLLPTLQSMKDSNPSLTLLDVGAGSGTISAAFAKLIPNGQVTATDLKTDILQRAEAIAEDAGVKNIRFQQANAYQLPFADGSFDITHCHQVLCHLKEPWKVLSEMLRVTKLGGVVAAREGDFETECLWPESSEFLEFHKLVARFMQSGGGCPTAGRELLSWALKTGAKRDQITASYGTWYYNTPADREVWGTFPKCSPLLRWTNIV
jgi:ubiquinone/menaquinone biosynthesis C-methylase UbiE